MSPVTHLIASWLVAARTTDNLRDRRLVALSGLLPDLDGAGLLVDLGEQAIHGGDSYYYYQQFHHFLLHGITGATVLALALAAFAQRRGRVAILAFLVIHLHFLCDLVGSRGPTPEDIWPLFYLGPFTFRHALSWDHQWALDAWPNRVFTLILLYYCLRLPLRLGDSVVGVFNRRADGVFVTVLQDWWEKLSLRITRSRRVEPY
jgi:inner membrane protein